MSRERMRAPHPVSRSKRGYAVGLASQHLTGDQRAEALAWLRSPHRSTADLDGFIDKIRAAHDPDAGEPQ